MDVFPRLGQFSVDGTGDGVNQVGPILMKRPQMGSAVLAKMPLVLALQDFTSSFDHCLINANILRALNLQTGSISARADAKTAPSLSLHADAAVTALVRNWMVTLRLEFHSSTGARPTNQHAAI